MDDTLPISSTYVSRVIPVPTDAAPRMFEDWWRARRRESGFYEMDLMALDVGYLSLDPLSWSRFTMSSPMTPIGRVLGRLGTGWLRSWPVEVELLPWSRTHSELGVRYSGRRRAWDASRYLQVVERALTSLGTDLLRHLPCPASEPVRTPDAA